MRRSHGLFERHGRALLLGGIAASLALAVILQWPAISSFDWHLSWGPFVAAVLLFSLGPLAGGTAFWLVLRDLAPSAPFGASLWVWARGFAGRYIPSGALTVAVRLVERQLVGASRAQMLSATVYEQVVAVAAAAAVSLTAFAYADRTPPTVAFVVLATALVTAGAAHPLVTWIGRRRADGHWEPGSVVVRSRVLFGAAFLCAASWLIAGLAAWIFVASLSEEPIGFAFLLGAYTFAWLIGFVIPLAPSGLGAREATLVAMLAPEVGVGAATALAVALRLATLAADFVAIGLVEAARVLAGTRNGRPGGRDCGAEAR